MVPKTNNPDAGTKKLPRTFTVVRFSFFTVMSAPIQLDGQHLIMAIKIKNIPVNGMLPSEFISTKPSIPEQSPQQLFGISLPHP